MPQAFRFSVEDFDLSLKACFGSLLSASPGITPRPLADSMEYTLLLPGKRIRPELCLATAWMLGVPEEAAIFAAQALEITHCFTLIHDDLPCMDDDDFRRGKPSNHKVFGEALALLAGDGLSALAPTLLLGAKDKVSSTALLQGLSTLLWAMGPSGVIAGQAHEMALGEDAPLEELIQVHFLKTGALFLACLLIPRDFAGIPLDSAQSEALIHFGKNLGLAFQIADDLEDAHQDGSQSNERNILHYLGRDKAIDLARNELGSGCTKLLSLWADRAEPLVEIANRLSSRIEAIE